MHPFAKIICISHFRQKNTLNNVPCEYIPGLNPYGGVPFVWCFFVSINGRHSKILIVRSLARSLARRENFSSTRKFRRCENFGKKSLGRCDRFRQKFVEIGANLAIFEPKYTSKNHTPLFGEFSRLSQDLCESDYDSIKSRDDRHVVFSSCNMMI